MKQTDKRFWIVWVITELLILSSCIYLAVPNSAFVMIGFLISQPLMVTLALYKMAHRNGAMVNCAIVCIYTVYYMYMHFTDADGNGWGVVIFYGITACHTACSSAAILGYSENCRNNITKKQLNELVIGA